MPIIPLNLETDTVQLPAPLLPQKVTLDEALKRRRSARSFIPDSISMEVLLPRCAWRTVGTTRGMSRALTASF